MARRYVSQPAGLAVRNDFGSNPGHLAMQIYTPARAPSAGGPLIVLLHGCGQSAMQFAEQGGWIRLADGLGVPLVLAQQSDDNNQGRCFNWFRPAHIGRGLGEGESIRQMAAAALRRFQASPERVYIAGLSAGGAMTASLLAAYPDFYAAGAVVAGLPVGAASGAAQAFGRMARADVKISPAALAQAVREAAPEHRKAWPRISIWCGTADSTVDPANGRLLAQQWTSVHGLNSVPAAVTDRPDSVCETWGSPDQPAVELWTLPGGGHAWPATATEQIAEFWQLGRY